MVGLAGDDTRVQKVVGPHSSVVTEQFEVNSARKHIGQFLIDFCIDVHNFLVYLHVIVMVNASHNELFQAKFTACMTSKLASCI